MATIKIKRGTTTPGFASLVQGEPAVDTSGNKFFIRTGTAGNSADVKWLGAEIETSPGDWTNANKLATQSAINTTFMPKAGGTFTGAVSFGQGSTAAGEIRLLEDTDDGSNYSAFRGSARSANITYVMPTTDPTAGQVLSASSPSSNVSTLSWVDSGGASTVAVTNDDTTTTLYPMFSTVTTGSTTTKIDSDGMTYDAANDQLNAVSVKASNVLILGDATNWEMIDYASNNIITGTFSSKTVDFIPLSTGEYEILNVGDTTNGANTTVRIANGDSGTFTKTISIGASNGASGTTAITIGSSTGTSTNTLNGNTTCAGDLAVNGADITTTSTGTATVFNTNATTVNMAGAATTVSIGAATGTTTINNANTVVTGDLAVNGADITTTATGTATVFNTNATTLNVGGAATTVSLGAGSGTTTVNNNLAVTGNLTVNGTTTTINSTVTTIDDPVLVLGGDTAPTSTDTKDRGIELRYGSTGTLTPTQYVVAAGGTQVTYTFNATVTGISPGGLITVTGAGQTNVNGTWIVGTVAGSTIIFTITNAATPGTYTSSLGTVSTVRVGFMGLDVSEGEYVFYKENVGTTSETYSAGTNSWATIGAANLRLRPVSISANYIDITGSPSANRTLTLPDVTSTVAVLGLAQTFTSAQTFRAASAVRSEAASTQDAIVLAGRAGGTGSFAVTLTPTTLASNTTLTLPNVTDTVAVLGTNQTFSGTQTFGNLTATGAITFNTTTNNQSYTTSGAGTITITSGTAGNINNMNIGASTRGTGAFTTLDANSTVGLSPANANVTISPTGTGTVSIAPAGVLTLGTAGVTTTVNGNVNAAASNQTIALSPTGSGTVTIQPAGGLTINPTTAGNINNTNIGATTAGTGRFSTITATSSITYNTAVIAAAGTTQATATTITTADVNFVTSGTGGVALPAAVAGRKIAIINRTSAAINVWPVNGGDDTIDGVGTGASAYVLQVGEYGEFDCSSATAWFTNGTIDGGSY
jgi:hypothetical protein